MKILDQRAGGFAVALARLFEIADSANKQKIIQAWPEFFQPTGGSGPHASRRACR